MKADILSIGTELLMGEITDTNSVFLASQLPVLGIQVQGITQVGDDLDLIVQTLKRSINRSDIVFTTGGLGPTQDDLTRETISMVLGETIRADKALVIDLEHYFQSRHMPMPHRNLKQATLIPSARSIPNSKGTAPGWWVEKNGTYIVAMPGPPGELHNMWFQEVLPALQNIPTGEIILTRNIKTMGLTEAEVDEIVSAYYGQKNPYLGIYAKPDGIHLRIIARASDEDKARTLVQPVEKGITQLLDSYIWGYDNATPQEEAIHLLKDLSLTLATMEHCTGGVLANRITEPDFSTPHVKGSLVSHSIEGLQQCGISESIIKSHGIISPEIAEAMALKAKTHFSTAVGIGITGVEGPSQVEGHPVGTVYTSIIIRDNLNHFSYHLPPRRALIRERAVTAALVELCRLLKKLS